MLLVLLTCLLPRLRHPLPPTYPVDFNVYYSAAQLVRHGDAAALYNGADTGANPQKLLAPPDAPLFRAAKAEGLSFVGLYVYPPLLADLLLPFTSLHVGPAQTLWLVANGLFLVLTALLVTRLLQLPWLGWGALLILVSLASFTPVLQCIHDGQITLFLLLLWVLGTVLYAEEHTGSAALVFALATAIKLTPALVLVPFLVWRNWRFVTIFGAALAALALLTVWIDTPHASSTYFTRVLPAMSAPLPVLTNDSLAAAAERIIALLQSGTVAPFPSALPPATVLLGRGLSAAVLLALIGAIARAGRQLSLASQVLVLALLGLMAPILSPVSWFHAYATAFLALVLLWRNCLRRSPSAGYLITLTAVSLLLGSAVGENLIALLATSNTLPSLATWLQFVQLAAGSLLCLYEIARLRPSVGAPRDRSPATNAREPAAIRT